MLSMRGNLLCLTALRKLLPDIAAGQPVDPSMRPPDPIAARERLRASGNDAAATPKATLGFLSEKRVMAKGKTGSTCRAFVVGRRHSAAVPGVRVD
jgi:hypothetical protein